MALNNYGPRGLLDTAPWSPAGLQAGSGLNRYTNMQPGGMPAPMRPDPVQMQQYAPPALRSLADSLAQYKAQAAAAAAPLVAQAPMQPGGSSSSSSSSSVGSPGFQQQSDNGFSSGVGSGESLGSQIGNMLGITGIGDGAKAGFVIGGPLGGLLGGLLGNSVASDPTNPYGVNAVNGADAGFSMVSDGPGWSGNDGGLSGAGLSGVEGFGGMGVTTGEGLGGGQAAGMGGGLLGGFDSAPVPAPAPAATYEPVYGAKTFAPGTSPSGYNANSVTMNGMLLGYKNSVTGEVTPTKPAGGSGYVPTSTYANPYDTYFSNSSNPYSGYQTYGTSEGE